ncbi:hypothetical protein KGF56_004402 [Candida oxycetoniae]|uniref:Uncharacterized protein n=1 Tax=Candida oxycetoniae TaxID=497107 RepID=A0AAI9SU63_9ASCO|nr:uncharacterized protein KGF56_004402 [Candida oxycetoniae]KAI3402728.2 hypothetical protein KGF56_004402 [Candida oxycetoniae]
MANPQDHVYQEFLNYSWEDCTEYQKYLKELQQSEVAEAELSQLIDQAKSFFFCQKTGHILNLEEFEDWKLHNDDKEESKSEKDTNRLVESDTSVSTNNVETKVGDDDDPPYSSNYHNLIELIMSGKPVPGIKPIPDVVLKDQGSISHQSQRTKPWER